MSIKEVFVEMKLDPDAKFKSQLLPPGCYDNFEDIYLAVPTNILCVDDRSEPEKINMDVDSFYYDISVIPDFIATLYLGKISFKKNKDGNLAPIYTPSVLTQKSFEGLNSFWLNEINAKRKMPPKSLIKCTFDDLYYRTTCEPSAENIPHLKVYYYRTKDNITLNEEQIISYFTELHSLNTTFIQNYIDSINENGYIEAYTNLDSFDDELLEKGILSKDMLEGSENILFEKTDFRPILIKLDYLKQSHQSNFKILLYHEFFYAYLAWSLREYLSTRYLIKHEEDIFNEGAYQKNNSYSFVPDINRLDIYHLAFMQDRFFFYSPNIKHRYRWIKGEKRPIRRDERVPLYTPSPLGNYYFQITANFGTYIEYYQRIYPSIKNPPKGWSKEMMSKLDLKLQ